ncbi:DEAD/DEAH box helicase family protein, partial [Shinella sumterensis]|uniref:DEAD/DEAH box helicase family protein n=2 Tax=Bacteria TaxID=2 RepID=UPI001E5FF0A0
ETALKGRFRFAAETETEDGLRRPQLGALHAILAYRSTEEHEPITVVMPTGTGKTETMLAAYCHSPAQTLVVVPSDALRTQIAEKFVTLGVLPRVHAVVGDFLCPAVLVLKSGLQTIDQVQQVLARSNVVVATAQVLNACSEEARSYLARSCQRLFVDEAHHLGARTWRQVV